MTFDHRIYNFSSGPAMLPESVLRKAQQALLNFDGTGIGIAEHSHRGAAFTGVIQQAEARCRELASIPDDYAVLFLHGGASTQFYTLPANLIVEGKAANIIDTGAWTTKAIAEAKHYGQVHVAGSSADDNYSYIPAADALSYSDNPAYVYYASNNTIFGTQWSSEPTPPGSVPLICDASSDIFSRSIDISNYGMLYGGTQKNLGPSGLALVIIRRDLIEAGNRALPTMMQYRTHAAKGSMFNTPPTFPIYVLGEVLAWIDEFGGLDAMEEFNRAKADALYDFIDDSSMFTAPVRPDSRSRMNVCFHSSSAELDATFVTQAAAKGLSTLKGHRSVGGLRASIYNAMPREGVDALIEFMKGFEREHG